MSITAVSAPPKRLVNVACHASASCGDGQRVHCMHYRMQDAGNLGVLIDKDQRVRHISVAEVHGTEALPRPTVQLNSPQD
jgi:hypothetical protein